MGQSEEQNSERRVKRAHTAWRKAREKLDAFMEDHRDVFNTTYDLTDEVNTKRKRFEQAARETGIGVGPITVVVGKKINFDADYVESLFDADDEILADLITTKKTVKKGVFEQLVKEGRINKRQAERAILSEEDTKRVNGVPAEIVLP